MVIVVVLPFEKVDVVGNPVAIQELIELLVIDAMRSFDLAVEMGCPRPDVHVADVARLEVPVEMRLKLRAVVRLDDVHPEGQSPEDLIDEGDVRPLITGGVYLQNADARAIVDRGELKEPATRAGDALEELHIDLESMPGLAFS